MKLTPKIFKRSRQEAASSRYADGMDWENSVEEKTLVQNIKVFEEYNTRKKAFLYHLLPKSKKTVFDLIPLLIHFQADELLTCVDDCRLSPCGIYGYEVGPETRVAYKEAFGNHEPSELHFKAAPSQNPAIKSISLIGSLGSIAQSNKSDFDYWICYDQKAFTEDSFYNFTNKLNEIERWADEYAGAEVHFFPMTTEAIRANDFGAVSTESAGTAQGKLLKEEFYRTMTLVTGQIPLWWIMPPGIEDGDYQNLKEIVIKSKRINNNELIDLDNVHSVSDQEFYGAAIWQINKVIGSPFKSVLKLALLEEYLFGRENKGLLCHELKARLQSGEENAVMLDPYILMLDRASDYFMETQRHNDLDLLRRSMYIKSGVRLELSDHRRTDLPRKKQIMADNVQKWGWNHRLVDHLNNYQHWSFRDVHKFNQEINRYLTRAYKNISAALKEQSTTQGRRISQRDLAVLGRKLYIFYSHRTNKVDSLLSLTDEQPALKGLTLQPETDLQGSQIWYIYRGLLSRNSISEGLGDRLKSSRYMHDILIWLINNRLYSTETTINLNQGFNQEPSNFTLPDLQSLLKALETFFHPSLSHEVSEAALLKPPEIQKMLLEVNLNAPDKSRAVTSSSLSYLNTWGEMFFKGFDSDEGILVARMFIRKHFAYDPVGVKSNFAVFIPDRAFKRDLGQRLNKYFGFRVVS